ncbi:MAG: DUF4920 domain-containing protein [Ignavibacteriae bacterium]|nr:DUF4920 domain-containing protein [Ignavibacteriota bacterium]
MKLIILLFCSCILLSCSGRNATFGAPFTLKSEKSITVSGAVKPANYDRIIRVEGDCYQVCQTEGCWLVVTDGKQKLHVIVKDKDFAAPMDCGGKKIALEGKVQEQLTNEDDAREYAGQAGRSEAETNAIIGDQRVPVFVITSMEVVQ